MARFSLKLVSGLVLSAAAMAGCGGGLRPPGDSEGTSAGRLGAAQCVKEAETFPKCDDEGVLKARAVASCASQGLELSQLEVDDACTVGGFSSARWICCNAAGQPQDAGPPSTCGVDSKDPDAGLPPTCGGAPQDPDAGLPPLCFVALQGGPASCEPSATLQKEAEAQCKTKGLALVTFSTGDSCGPDMFRYAKYQCCEQVASPPSPAPTCFSAVLGDPQTCRTNEELKQSAFDLCQTKGAMLSRASFKPCAGTTALSVFIEFDCCQ